MSSIVRDLTHVNFKDIMNQMSESEVQLSLPRFKIDYELELIPLLKNVSVFIPASQTPETIMLNNM